MCVKSGNMCLIYPHYYADVLPRSPCSLIFPNLCDNFVKKLVYEIRKCRQLQGPNLTVKEQLQSMETSQRRQKLLLWKWRRSLLCRQIVDSFAIVMASRKQF